jgi:hypothetical protein
MPLITASIAGLPATKAWVSVGPVIPKRSVENRGQYCWRITIGGRADIGRSVYAAIAQSFGVGQSTIAKDIIAFRSNKIIAPPSLSAVLPEIKVRFEMARPL